MSRTLPRERSGRLLMEESNSGAVTADFLKAKDEL
jgi:hypothetical protein